MLNALEHRRKNISYWVNSVQSPDLRCAVNVKEILPSYHCSWHRNLSPLISWVNTACQVVLHQHLIFFNTALSFTSNSAKLKDHFIQGSISTFGFKALHYLYGDSHARWKSKEKVRSAVDCKLKCRTGQTNEHVGKLKKKKIRECGSCISIMFELTKLGESQVRIAPRSTFGAGSLSDSNRYMSWIAFKFGSLFWFGSHREYRFEWIT